MKKTKINLNSKINFINTTKNLGRAEFHFCPVFKYGYLRKLYIIRAQQEINEVFVLDLKKELPDWKVNTFDITSWAHKTDPPVIWLNFWCKEHKTICFKTYVPLNTRTIEFDAHFGNTLTIRFV